MNSWRWITKTALRYLVSGRKKKMRFAVISILAITAGYIAIIVIIGIMNGLQLGFIRDVVEINSYHIRVESVESAALPDLIESIEKFDQVSYAFPFLEVEGVLRAANGRTYPCRIKGVPDTYFLEDTGAAGEVYQVAGDFTSLSEDSLIIGRTSALNLGIGNNSLVDILVLGEGKTINLVPLEKSIRISGVFYTGYPEIDGLVCFTSLDLLEKILQRTVPTIGVKAKDSAKLSSLKDSISKLPGVTEASTWQELNRELYSALMLEKYSMMIVLFLIFLVAVYNMKNSIERYIFLERKELGLLAALGASKRELIAVFVMQGTLIGITGTVIGVLAGTLIAENLNFLVTAAGSLYHVLTGADSSFFSYLFPVSLIPSEIALIALFVLLLTVLASLFAVRSITKLDPVRILHYE